MAVAAPALAFPFAVPWLTVSCLSIAVVWLVAANVRGRDHEGTLRDFDSPLRLPLTALFAFALIGSCVSNYLLWTLPKLAALTLGLLTFRGILLTGTSASRVRMLGLAYLLFGLATILFAVLSGPAWKYGISRLYHLGLAIPQVFGLLKAENAVNPNALGGTTLFFLPVSAALAWGWPIIRQAKGTTGAFRERIGFEVLKRGLYALSAFAFCVVLVLSQSRTAWVASVVSVLLILSIRSRIVAVLCSITGATAFLSAWWIGPANVLGALESRFPNDFGSLANQDRTLIWTFAVRAIQDRPWTGVGLGAFRAVVESMKVDGTSYPVRVPHAHNTFLQVALDVGIPGLIAYLALLAVVSYMTWRIIRHGRDARLRSLCVGLWGALFAIHLFGLMDAIALGAKVGLFFWCNMGLIAASYNIVVSEECGEHS